MQSQPQLRSIGQRIADARKAQGLNQQQLADRGHVSVSLLRKVEQGSRDATAGLIAAIAKALSVETVALTGQPYDQKGQHPDRIHNHIPALRRALTYWDLAPSPRVAPRPWRQLLAEGRHVASMRRDAQHAALAQRLPALLTEITAAAHQSTGPARDKWFGLLSVMLFAAHSATYKTGYKDLSTVVESRLTWAAELSGDPLLGALAAWARTTSMLHHGSYDIGQQLLSRVQGDIDPGGHADHRPALRVAGPLHLRSAILAARAGDADAANSHLAEARTIANHLGDTDGDGGWHQLSFGPSNVGIHEVAAAVELGDGAAALARARTLHFSPEVPRIRVSHHYIDLARAQLWSGDREAAVRSLYSAREFAPQQTRHHPTTHEVVRMLIRMQRRSNEPLVQLASWLGADLSA